MSLTPFIHAMGRGPSRARSLTRDEAAEAMMLILSGETPPEAVGALLMLMRYRGETAEEIAGFTSAIREELAEWQRVDAALDWPSYAAGRSRGQPWFLLAAKLIGEAGYPVLLHGWNSHQNPVADVRAALPAIGIPIVRTAAQAAVRLKREKVVYVPLEAMNERVLDLLRLRDVLGLRSAVNTVCRMLNPSFAETAVQGVFHPSYRELQQDTALLLGTTNMAVLKGGGGEFERHPAKNITLFGLRNCTALNTTAPARLRLHCRLADQTMSPEHLSAVWIGSASDPFAEEIIIGTAGAALFALHAAPEIDDCDRLARELWGARLKRLAA